MAEIIIHTFSLSALDAGKYVKYWVAEGLSVYQ
jgi:hypothetical protein